MLAPKTKVTVLSWWALETHMNPDRKEVVRKILAPKVYEEKPT